MNPKQCQMICCTNNDGGKTVDKQCRETGLRQLDGYWFCWVHAVTYELKSRKFTLVPAL